MILRKWYCSLFGTYWLSFGIVCPIPRARIQQLSGCGKKRRREEKNWKKSERNSEQVQRELKRRKKWQVYLPIFAHFMGEGWQNWISLISGIAPSIPRASNLRFKWVIWPRFSASFWSLLPRIRVKAKESRRRKKSLFSGLFCPTFCPLNVFPSHFHPLQICISLSSSS